ncbi:unnamed protein product (macronuclear) [Paramecium tetraurelia]|uniref:Uncharacterized protein n=1 Tax=Paramecium tetraurelia TaxID=5888 RepID=A0BEA3_PARTE|nr:uncharacterized protein GSPATT00027903001 [Paramecium tetraurelia]CAK56870.1 unnamed protein product [Paramecium tetraurelia]|eukprot:XP_001424268.1 hypothetical protein (macronuclear) [Paramecium tetraurelia strain d4-2]
MDGSMIQRCQKIQLVTNSGQNVSEILLNSATDAISTINHNVFETPVKSYVFRRVSQFEFIGSKQKKPLQSGSFDLSLSTFKRGSSPKKRKVNKLKLQYNLTTKNAIAILKVGVENYQPFSKSLIKHPKLIVTNSMKVPTQNQSHVQREELIFYCKEGETPIQSQDQKLEYQNKQNYYASKDKLLKYHKIMDKKLVIYSIYQDQFDSSCESSSSKIFKVQFNATQFSKLNKINSGNNQCLTHEQNYSFFKRKASQSVVTQQVMEKIKIQKIFLNKNNLKQFKKVQMNLIQISLLKKEVLIMPDLINSCFKPKFQINCLHKFNRIINKLNLFFISQKQ